MKTGDKVQHKHSNKRGLIEDVKTSIILVRVVGTREARWFDARDWKVACRWRR